jgi:hypothetical protein
VEHVGLYTLFRYRTLLRKNVVLTHLRRWQNCVPNRATRGIKIYFNRIGRKEGRGTKWMKKMMDGAVDEDMIEMAAL